MNRNNTMQNIQYVSAIHLGIQCLEERKDKADLGAAQDLRKLANEIIPGSGNMDVGKVKSQYHLPTDLMKEINKGGKRKHKKKKRKTKKTNAAIEIKPNDEKDVVVTIHLLIFYNKLN